MSAAAAVLFFLPALPSQDVGLAAETPLIKEYLWAVAPANREAARRRLEALNYGQRELSRFQFTFVEKIVREERTYEKADHRIEHVLVTGGRALRVRVVLPESYLPGRAHPLLVVMGGGPVPSPRVAKSQAAQMTNLWRRLTQKKGWILASVEDRISIAEGPGELRFEMLRPADFREVVRTVRDRFHVHPNRVYATGISLGANYALHFAASHPQWFAGILPVSSEGESREYVVRNLSNVSVYCINGARDRRIRSIHGPRKLWEIMKKLKMRAGYEEHPDRGHDSFPGRYEEVLKWLKNGPRNPWPRRLERIPHEGLFPVSRRVYWLEADSDQATVRAEVVRQEIHLHALRTRRLRLWLSDNLLDLDKPIVIRINGRVVFEGEVNRTLKAALDTAAEDPGVLAAASLEFGVPLDGVAREEAYRWSATLRPTIQETRLPWWDHYARRTLQERRYQCSLEGDKLGVQEILDLDFPEGLTGVRVTGLDPEGPEARAGLREGDILTGFDDEVFFRDGLGISLISEIFLRKPGVPGSYTLSLIRDGELARLVVPLR